MIELSIVILVIAVLVLGVVIGGRLIKNSKVTSAKSSVNSSTLPLIDGLAFWIESVSDSSFSAAETIDGKELT